MFGFRELASSLLDIAAPRLCAGCREPLSLRPAPSPHDPARDPVRAALREALCPRCRSELVTIGPGACRSCGRARLAFSQARGDRCGRCLAEPRGGIRSTVAVFRYTGAGRLLIRRLKYYGRSELALPIGRALAARVSEELPDITGACAIALVTAVPLHWTRRLLRGYNQAELIARSCARELGLPFERRALARTRRTRALYSVSKKDREEALAGSLTGRETIVEGKWVLLV
ncbi:ComF family protein, partial [bacterium]|nr:ComF family protein [bacterium]